ncbi:MAG: phosphoglycerate kinase [Candidatus Nealsonbacteria bacterium]|nr:phosphoglycerate kinase [Candidatus Nealsonbacteria bacterium]
MKTIRDFGVRNKRVLVRADFNVPLSPPAGGQEKQGEILDDLRIRATLPTIDYLINNGAKIILMSHLDSPGGKVVEELKLDKVQERLMEYLDLSITKAPDCIGPKIEKWTKEMRPGEILLLENLRFRKEEENNDENFAADLSKLGDIYINDAFGVSHRAHASIVGVPKHLPSGAGFLLEKEIKTLNMILKNPDKPLIAIVGGVKAETKGAIIDRISKVADWVLVGNIIAKNIDGKKVLKPVDGAKDIGPKTIEIFKEKIFQAKTVFWSGPLGMVEKKEFQKGSLEIAKSIVESKAFSVAGGGETTEFINKIGFEDKFSYISTGGGAMLEFLSGKKLPGIESLNVIIR